MQTSKEYRHNAEICLRLASETKEVYARMALIDLATEFRALAEALERLPRAAQPKKPFAIPRQHERGVLRSGPVVEGQHDLALAQKSRGS